MLAIMATVLTLALTVLVDGVLSLALDRDVIAEPDAGPLVAVAMTGTVCLIVFVVTLRRAPVGRLARMATTALACVVLAPLAGAVGYAVVRDEPAVVPVFLGAYVLGPFVIAAAVVASAVVLAHSFVPSGDDVR